MKWPAKISCSFSERLTKDPLGRPEQLSRPQTTEGKEAPSFPETGASDNDTSHDGQYEPNERKIAMDQMLYEGAGRHPDLLP